MSFVPHKACALAIGLQSALGVDDATPHLIPLPGGADAMTNRKNYSFFQYSGVQWQRALYETEGQSVEGTITVPLIPGFLASDDEIFHKWIWGRNPDLAAYAQGYYATVYRQVGDLEEKYRDVKCTGGTIGLDYGQQFPSMELNLVGIQPPAEAGIDFSLIDRTMFTVKPYSYKGAALSLLDSEGVALGDSSVTRNHSIKWDNKNVAPADMGVLNGSTFPIALPEEALAEWGGSFDKYFLAGDTPVQAIYQAFLAGAEAQYALSITQFPGALAPGAVVTFTFPRILFTEDPLKLPDSGLVKEEGIAWEALGKMDGTIPACTISETAPA